MTTCPGTKPNGDPCGRTPQPGLPHCNSCDPERKAERVAQHQTEGQMARDLLALQQILQGRRSGVAPTLILSVPLGWLGSAHELCGTLGCSSIVADWCPGMDMQPGALHITHTHPDDLHSRGCEHIVTTGWPPAKAGMPRATAKATARAAA